jgi:putative nucleotidyltransferase with HDIG domain
MLKRIPVDRLATGMFVHEFCGSWMNHPFWRSRFLLPDAATVRRIVDSGVREVWIDTDKGRDSVDAAAAADVRQDVERSLEFAASEPMQWPEQPATFEDEAKKAAALCRKSKAAVDSLFTQARLGQAIDVQGCLPLVDEISDSVMRNPGALISVARLKSSDEYTYMHSVAVCALMVALGQQMGLQGEALREAGLAGLLHDVGKAKVPLEILNKPGKLSDAEFAVMRGHAERGHALLADMGVVAPAVLDVCLHHHERMDGQGYPHRLRGADIAMLTRMGAVCDVYDAVTSHRPYKAGWDPGEALRQMAQWQGHFDPMVLQAFVKTVGIYPVGSLVKLKSERLAVVAEQNPQALLKPKVKVFYSLRSGQRVMPEDLDLASPWTQDKIVGCEQPGDWAFGDLDRLWAGVSLRL